MPAREVDAVASLDSARRALVLLGALLYPLSDERAALAAGDAESYVDAVAARMRGVCAQSQAILENSLKALDGGAGDTKSPRNRRKLRSSPGLPEDVGEEVDRILVECDVPDALEWLEQGASIGGDPRTPLEDLVPLAVRVAAAAVRLSATAADRIDPSTATANGGDDDAERAAVVVGGTVRTARRIARVLDEWDLCAGSPTAIIGCPPPPGSAPDGSDPRPDSEETGRRSLGVAAALAGGESPVAGAARSDALRRTRTDTVWSAGGAVQRD